METKIVRSLQYATQDTSSLTLKYGDSFMAVTELMCSLTFVNRSSQPRMILHLFW